MGDWILPADEVQRRLDAYQAVCLILSNLYDCKSSDDYYLVIEDILNHIPEARNA